MTTYSATIFTKTYDLLVWLMPLTEKSPKSQRFVLARRIQGALLDFYELTVRARRTADRLPVLQQADLLLGAFHIFGRKVTGT